MLTFTLAQCRKHKMCSSGLKRAASWLAYHDAVRRWPWDAAYGITRPIYCALLPWAGLWAYAPDGGGL